MNDSIHEQLSALIDDELPDTEQALLIRQLGANAGLQQVYSRYQLASDVLRNHVAPRIDPGFHARVHAALEQEATLHHAFHPRARWYRALAGTAIAASVAIVAVVSLQNSRLDSSVPAATVASAPAADSLFRAVNTPLPVATPVAARGLDVYLVDHNEYAVNRGMQGMLPYMRIIGQHLQPDSGGDSE